MSLGNKKRDTWSDDGLKTVRELDEALGGDGIEVLLGSPETGGVSYFSSKMPPIIIQEHNARRVVAVEVSSVEHVEKDNQKLLHFLFRKTIER